MQPSTVDADRHSFSFTGSGGEYFRIWIVNILLSIVTLYIYSAWAKVRNKRYFHGNTVLDGSSFEYHARPLQILAGRIVAVLLLIAVTFSGLLHPLAPLVASGILLLVLPWAVWKSTQFNARMTSYRNVRFGFGGGLGRMYAYILIVPFLPLIVAGAIAAASYFLTGGIEAVAVLSGLGVFGFYALSPWAHKKLAEYFADNYRYGRAAFAATLSTRRFYGIYVKAFLLSLSIVLGVILVILTIALAATVLGVVNGLTPENAVAWLEAWAEEGEAGLAMSAIFLLYPLFFLAGYLVTAYFRARLREHLYASTVIDGRVHLESTVRTWPLWRLLVGNLLLLVFTLGLAWPWVQVRIARFHARNTAVLAEGGLHAVVDEERARQSALGEELGDAFDMGMDVGF